MVSPDLAVFALFAAVTLGASIGVVLVNDVFYNALFLGLALISVAAHFVLLQASFLAAVQILVYVGGVLILIAFAIMFMRSTVEEADEAEAG